MHKNTQKDTAPMWLDVFQQKRLSAVWYTIVYFTPHAEPNASSSVDMSIPLSSEMSSTAGRLSNPC